MLASIRDRAAEARSIKIRMDRIFLSFLLKTLTLVRCRPLRMIDDKNFHRALSR